MTTTEKKSISEQVIEFLYEKGPMTAKQLGGFIPFEVRRIHTKCLELLKKELLERKGGGGPQGKEFIWSLAPGVNPRTMATGELDEVGDDDGGSEETPKPPDARRTKELKSLDPQGIFEQHLKNVGVGKDVIPTIAEVFFSGDVDSLTWLNKVLTRAGANFIRPDQKRLMISFWANTRGLPYREEDYFAEDEEEEKGKKTKKEGSEPKRPLDTGQGWRVGKDKHGDWVALPGGPMVYDEAVAAAERRALIASYGTPTIEEEAGEVEEGEEGKPRRTGGKRPESVVDYMMKKVIDSFVDGTKGRGDGESTEVRRLTERIEDMERERQEERFERIEGLVAQAVNRDPWDDYDRIQKMKERLGAGGPIVTDQSPAVQLIKDSTDKVDKNVNRLVGIVERVVLKSDEFRPEETRSPEEREKRAGEILDTAHSGDRHRRVRRDTFGI